MTNLKRKLGEDKATRDAARALIEADVDHVKALASTGHLKERASEKISDKGGEALKAAGDVADKNKGYITALVGAVILWLAREPIQALFEKLSEHLGGDEQKPGATGPEPEAEENP